MWFSKANLKANRIFTAKKDFSAKVEVVDSSQRVISEFMDDQYYNNVNEFYLTFFSNLKMQKHYTANLLQAKLMSKIYQS